MAVHGIDDVARAELQSRLARHDLAGELKGQLGRMLNQPTIHFYDLDHGNRQSDTLGQLGGEKVVGENALVLGIVLELDDVEVRVVGPHEMALRTAAHTFHVLHCLDRQKNPRESPRWLRTSNGQDRGEWGKSSVMKDT